jgi:hypothetical protein
MKNMEVPTRALVIASPHIDRILAGEKIWEMRSRNCRIRGPIGLIKKGSGKVVGLAEITGVIGPLSNDEMLANQEKHRINPQRLADPAVAKWNRAWVLSNIKALNHPVHYIHKNGAQSWIVLDDEAVEEIRRIQE